MALRPPQQQTALRLYQLAISKGLAPNRAREFVAAAYAESGLDPHATNRSSGAAGLFQLLSSGYRQKAQSLGGLYNPQANALAILPDYQNYWKAHPGALPGEGGRDVERSGQGAGFYSRPLSEIGKFGGRSPLAAPGPSPPQPSLPGATAAAPDPRQVLARQITGQLASGGQVNFLALAKQLASQPQPQLQAQKMTAESSARGATPPVQPAMTKPGKWVTVSPSADRHGVPTNPAVLQFAAKVAQVYGSRLTIGTGSNHNEFVKGTNRQSDHWFGEAADIPSSGKSLTRLGQDALIAAGADPKWARKQTGGVFNIGPYNILFNTNVGGNHYNHLHVGLGRQLGRHF